MQTITTEDTKAAFDEVVVKAQNAPVHVQAEGRDVAVILSDLYAFLLSERPAGINPRIAALL